MFNNYIKQLCMFVLSSSLVLGFVLSISLLVIGKMSININFDFEALDALWLILGLPLVSLLILILLSPLSFLIHKLLSKEDVEDVPPAP
jgi:hypothetical protein